MMIAPGQWLTMAGAALIAALLTAGLIRRRLRSADLSGLMDLPNQRSLHEKPTPRIGGLLMFVGASTGFAMMTGCQFPPAHPLGESAGPLAVSCLAALCLVLLGYRDDRHPLPVLPRLLIHLLCAIAIAAATIPHGLTSGLAGLGVTGVLMLLAAMLATAWFTNLYNFMDGANGLAGLMTLSGFGTYALIAPPGSLVGLLSAALAGAALGFLCFNWDPAKLFMGDAGSIPLGFLAAGIGLTGAAAGYWPWLAPVGIFLPFVFDATTTLAIRAWRGENLSRAHRQHAYQQAILAGWSHRRTATVYGLLMAACSLTSATFGYHNGSVSFALWAVIILIHASLGIAVRRLARSAGQAI